MNPKVVRFNETDSSDSLTHWGVKGMKWGTRQYQYKDGSLTPEGREHYGVGDAREKQKLKMEAERQKADLEYKRNKREAKLQIKMDRAAAKNDAIRLKAEQEARLQEASNERIEEKNRHKESGLGKKLIIGAGLTVGAIAIIKAFNNRKVADLPKTDSSVLEENKSLKDMLSKSTSELDMYKSSHEASQKLLTKMRDDNKSLVSIAKSAAERANHNASVARMYRGEAAAAKADLNTVKGVFEDLWKVKRAGGGTGKIVF